MKLKYGVGDEVLIKCVVKRVVVDKEGWKYEVGNNDSFLYLTVPEGEICEEE